MISSIFSIIDSTGVIINTNSLPIIIVGSGSVGVRLVHQLLYLDSLQPIKIFGGEEEKPYSREHLLEVLAGTSTKDSLYESSKLPDNKNLQVFLNNPIAKIDGEKKLVTDSNGDSHPYSSHIMAVGATPNTLHIPGLGLKNIFTFRNVRDAELLKNRQISSRNTVIIGGGKVGLDTANAMQRHNTNVTVIESSTRLMYHQLDDHASVYLRLYMDNLGIDVRTNSHVTELVGTDKVEQVILNDGEVIPCDTVIISIGIKPNVDLAINSGIRISKGIVVDNKLQTNIQNIYAIGECSEFNGVVFGSVYPGFEQAECLAKILIQNTGKYKGSTATSQLNVVDYPILSIGDNGDDYIGNKSIRYRDIKHMTYRKLVLHNGKLRGIVATGKWTDRKRLHQMVKNNQRIWPWQRSRFEKMGEI